MTLVELKWINYSERLKLLFQILCMWIRLLSPSLREAMAGAPQAKSSRVQKPHIYILLKRWRMLQQGHTEIGEGKVRLRNSFHITFGKWGLHSMRSFQGFNICWKIREATIYPPANKKVLREKEENGEKRRQIMKWEQSHSLKNVTCNIEKGHFEKQYLLK